jgi:hypothetical protein
MGLGTAASYAVGEAFMDRYKLLADDLPDDDLLTEETHPVRQCPTCLSQRLYPSRARNAFETMLVKMGGNLCRCYVCYRRQVWFGMSGMTLSDARKTRGSERTHTPQPAPEAEHELPVLQSPTPRQSAPKTLFAAQSRLFSAESHGSGAEITEMDVEVALYKSRIALELSKAPKCKPMEFLTSNDFTAPDDTCDVEQIHLEEAAHHLDEPHLAQLSSAICAVPEFEPLRHVHSRKPRRPSDEEAPAQTQQQPVAIVELEQPPEPAAPITSIAARLRFQLEQKGVSGLPARDLSVIVTDAKRRIHAHSTDREPVTEEAPLSLQPQSA